METKQRSLNERLKAWHSGDKSDFASSRHTQSQTSTFNRDLLGKTLRSIKHEHETLQTALANARKRSDTAKFRFSKLQAFGSGSLAYSSLQEGLQYFMDESGYIAYRQLPDSNDSVLTLSDPICPDQSKKDFLEKFLQHKKDPIFLHINEHTSRVLCDLGFTVNELGVETLIDIQEFNLKGGKKAQLRAARNNAVRDDLSVIELESLDDLVLKSFKQISDDWLKEKVASDTEMRFLVRPMLYTDEMDVRKFVALKDNEIVGFVIFDPIYQNGNITGYIANHLRTNLKRSYSVVDYIILEALSQFKKEGRQILSLGLSPLAKVDDSGKFKHSKLLTAYFKYAFEKANFLYNFKNLAYHKLKYRPGMPGAREVKVFCAMKTRFLLIRLSSVYRVLGLKPLHESLAIHMRSRMQNWIATGIKRCFKNDSCDNHTHDDQS